MKPKLNWRNLRSFKCPTPDCGTPLKTFKPPNGESVHQCPKCGFKIRNSRLEEVLVEMRKPKLK